MFLFVKLKRILLLILKILKISLKLIPPRGCAFVEFVDRKTAAKCLDRMKDDYRLDGNHIKVYFTLGFSIIGICLIIIQDLVH
jgi:hypothetical protein